MSRHSKLDKCIPTENLGLIEREQMRDYDAAKVVSSLKAGCTIYYHGTHMNLFDDEFPMESVIMPIPKLLLGNWAFTITIPTKLTPIHLRKLTELLDVGEELPDYKETLEALTNIGVEAGLGVNASRTFFDSVMTAIGEVDRTIVEVECKSLNNGDIHDLIIFVRNYEKISWNDWLHEILPE